jgi:methane monooxygenase regulatory protein B
MTLDISVPAEPATPKRARVRASTTAERIAGLDPVKMKERMFSDEPVHETRRVVLCLMKCEEIEVVIEHLEEVYADNETFIVEDAGTFYRIDCDDHFEIDLDEIEPIIGRRYGVFDFMVNVTTTIGRAYNDGNKFVMTTELMGLDKPLPKFKRRTDDDDLDDTDLD